MTVAPRSPILRNLTVAVLTVASFAAGGLMMATTPARPVLKPTSSTATILIDLTVPTTSTTERTTTLPPTIATWGPGRPRPTTPSVPTMQANQVASTKPITTREGTTPPPSVYWADCDQAHAAGATPIPRGTPGYRAGLDRDGDGIACETGGGSTSTTGATSTTATVPTSTATTSTTTSTTSTSTPTTSTSQPTSTTATATTTTINTTTTS